MGRCTRCSCTHYVAPSIPQSIGQKLSGGAFLGCANPDCGHHVNLHEWYYYALNYGLIKLFK